jgi:hypothetical protein
MIGGEIIGIMIIKTKISMMIQIGVMIIRIKTVKMVKEIIRAILENSQYFLKLAHLHGHSLQLQQT